MSPLGEGQKDSSGAASPFSMRDAVRDYAEKAEKVKSALARIAAIVDELSCELK